MCMSIKALSEYTLYSKYARFLPEKKRRETWEEQVARVMGMHHTKYGEKLLELEDELKELTSLVKKKALLGSQRALQFGGDPILKHEAKMYNCTATYADRMDFFKEAMYLLLCGCGVGFSVQTHHVEKMPEIAPRTKGVREFVVPDSIEGWADAVGVLVSSYFVHDQDYYVHDLGVSLPCFSGYEVKFDYSVIRPAGAPIGWGGIAPGHKSLERSLELVKSLFEQALKERNKLKPIEVYDMVMHISDAVLGGGVRRSATICLFSAHDQEMLKAKTGDWFIKNPQRGRSNNSVVLLRSATSKEQFDALYENVKAFGEPGFVWVDDLEALFNPCVEIGLYAYDEEGRSGWQFCNLCEINMKKCKTPEQFLHACKMAAILGTLQAGYDNFSYLSDVTRNIVKKEALLGVSMTGMMDSPDIAFNEELQRKGAQLILDTNSRIAKIIGINECARATCVKPAGTTSIILGSANGVHPHHANRYFRRVQANKMDFTTKVFQQHNPLAVEESVWSSNGSDVVLTFLCEIAPGARTKNQVDALALLEYVKLTQSNWVEYGTRKSACVQPWLKHNVSNTINVKEQEWDAVRDFLYENKQYFTGVSILSMNGDKDYPQAPFCTVYTPAEIVKEYGNGSLMASGLIVDGLHAFENNLWKACDYAMGISQVSPVEEPSFEEVKTPEQAVAYYEARKVYELYKLKVDWVRRAKKFADKYFDSNVKKMTYCLKDVHNWKQWCDLSQQWTDIDWSDVVEEDYRVKADTIGAEACAGGKCEIGDLGAAIEAKSNKGE